MKDFNDFIDQVRADNSALDNSEIRKAARKLLKEHKIECYNEFWVGNPTTECYGKIHTRESLEKMLGKMEAMTQILVSL